MKHVWTALVLLAAPAAAEPGFGPGPNCFTGTYPAGSYPPSDLRALRFALDMRHMPGPGKTFVDNDGMLAARFGPPSLARREYFNWPTCGWGAGRIERCGGGNDGEIIEVAWQSDDLLLTTGHLRLEQGEMPNTRSEVIGGDPSIAPEVDLRPDLHPTVSVTLRLSRAPIAACAGIGPWDWPVWD